MTVLQIDWAKVVQTHLLDLVHAILSCSSRQLLETRQCRRCRWLVVWTSRLDDSQTVLWWTHLAPVSIVSQKSGSVGTDTAAGGSQLAAPSLALPGEGVYPSSACRAGHSSVGLFTHGPSQEFDTSSLLVIQNIVTSSQEASRVQNELRDCQVFYSCCR